MDRKFSDAKSITQALIAAGMDAKFSLDPNGPLPEIMYGVDPNDHNPIPVRGAGGNSKCDGIRFSENSKIFTPCPSKPKEGCSHPTLRLCRVCCKVYRSYRPQYDCAAHAIPKALDNNKYGHISYESRVRAFELRHESIVRTNDIILQFIDDNPEWTFESFRSFLNKESLRRTTSNKPGPSRNQWKAKVKEVAKPNKKRSAPSPVKNSPVGYGIWCQTHKVYTCSKTCEYVNVKVSEAIAFLQKFPHPIIDHMEEFSANVLHWIEGHQQWTLGTLASLVHREKLDVMDDGGDTDDEPLIKKARVVDKVLEAKETSPPPPQVSFPPIATAAPVYLPPTQVSSPSVAVATSTPPKPPWSSAYEEWSEIKKESKLRGVTQHNTDTKASSPVAAMATSTPPKPTTPPNHPKPPPPPIHNPQPEFISTDPEITALQNELNQLKDTTASAQRILDTRKDEWEAGMRELKEYRASLEAQEQQLKKEREDMALERAKNKLKEDIKTAKADAEKLKSAFAEQDQKRKQMNVSRQKEIRKCWEQHRTVTGEFYYFNNVTKRSAWENTTGVQLKLCERCAKSPGICMNEANAAVQNAQQAFQAIANTQASVRVGGIDVKASQAKIATAQNPKPAQRDPAPALNTLLAAAVATSSASSSSSAPSILSKSKAVPPVPVFTSAATVAATTAAAIVANGVTAK